jgi:hypothetical protein
MREDTMEVIYTVARPPVATVASTAKPKKKTTPKLDSMQGNLSDPWTFYAIVKSGQCADSPRNTVYLPVFALGSDAEFFNLTLDSRQSLGSR